MAHRSLPPSDIDADTDPDTDPFWHDAFGHPRWWERWSTLGRSMRSWAIVAAGVGVVALAGWWLLRPGAPPVETSLPMAGNAPATASGATGEAAAGSTSAGVSGPAGAATTSAPPGQVVVQAAGAVSDPGVYTLPTDARVDDLVEAAGGLSRTADLDRVNLAAPVVDGERVWVPSQGEDEVPEVVAGLGGGAGAGTAGGTWPAGSTATSAAPGAPVDLNTASAEQLDSLPGVGPATSAAILAYRDENGPFSSVEELLEVRGIGDAKLEQLRPLVRV